MLSNLQNRARFIQVSDTDNGQTQPIEKLASHLYRGTKSMTRTMAPHDRDVDLNIYNNDKSTKKEKNRLLKDNKKWVYDMARQCADYMDNGEDVFKDLKDALKQ